MDIEVTGIIERIKSGKTTEADLKNTEKALRLLKFTNELIDGDEVHRNDVDLIGKEVGERLCSARKEAGLTQDQLAAKSKISQGTISKIEKGQRVLSVGEAKKAAKILKVTAEYLIAGD